MPIAEITALITLATAALSDAQRSRTIAPHGLSDQRLWQVVVSGGDPLQGMDLRTAITIDPRRIDAAIRQAIYRAMHRQIPADPQSARLDEGLYLYGLDAARKAAGGEAGATELISIFEDNWWTLLGGTARTWPPFVRQALLNDWPAIERGFDAGRQIARQATTEAVAMGDPSAEDWGVYQDVLHDMEQGLRHVLEQGTMPALPGDVVQRLREIPGSQTLQMQRRILPRTGGAARPEPGGTPARRSLAQGALRITEAGDGWESTYSYLGSVQRGSASTAGQAALHAVAAWVLQASTVDEFWEAYDAVLSHDALWGDLRNMDPDAERLLEDLVLDESGMPAIGTQ